MKSFEDSRPEEITKEVNDHLQVMTISKLIQQRDAARRQVEMLLLQMEKDTQKEAIAELKNLWPNWRQLVDGFMQYPEWNNEWDAATRQSMIDWGMKWL